jgi:hypothetical protein
LTDSEGEEYGVISVPASCKGQLVAYPADERTPRILNRDGTDVCPFEKMTEPLKSSHEVFHALVEFFENKH